MAVLLSILKITGIVLLIILLAFLAVVACILFVPVRYQGRRGKILITNMTGETNMNMDQCQLSERTVLEPYEAKVILYEYL